MVRRRLRVWLDVEHLDKDALADGGNERQGLFAQVRVVVLPREGETVAHVRVMDQSAVRAAMVVLGVARRSSSCAAAACAVEADKDAKGLDGAHGAAHDGADGGRRRGR